MKIIPFPQKKIIKSRDLSDPNPAFGFANNPKLAATSKQGFASKISRVFKTLFFGNSMIYLLLFLGAYFFSAKASEKEKREWLNEISPAQKLAEKKQVPLLIAFLAPEWCLFSNAFEEEVLSDEKFIHSLQNKFIFLRIEIPRDHDKSPFEGSQLKEKYHVEECPSVVLAESNGTEIAKIDCTLRDSQAIAQMIHATLEDYQEMNKISNQRQLQSLKFPELKSLYSKAQKLSDPSFKRNVLKEGLKTDRGPYFLLKEYEQLLFEGIKKNTKLLRIRNKISARDPENILGFRRKIALLDFEALTNIKKPQKANKVIKPLEEYLKNFGAKDPEHAWQFEMKISQYLFGKNEIQESLKHAENSLKLAPESEKNHIIQSIEYLRNFHDDSMEK